MFNLLFMYKKFVKSIEKILIISYNYDYKYFGFVINVKIQRKLTIHRKNIGFKSYKICFRFG